MTFIRENLPDALDYFQGRGQKIFGKRGKQFRTTCTLHGGTGDTLSVRRDTGVWYCFSCQASGSDVLAYAMQADGLDFISAAKALGAWREDGKPAPDYKPTPITAREAINLLSNECQLILATGATIRGGHPVTTQDIERCAKAMGRINKVREMFQL